MDAMDAVSQPATGHGPGREAAIETVVEAARANRAEFGSRRRLSDDMVALLRRAGIYRALVARRFGGDECSPSDFLRLIERISIADGSTGWVASFGFSAIYLSALPIATLEAMYANGPDVIFAGGVYPPQPAKPVARGLLVSGRWGWGSGVHGADLIGVGIIEPGRDGQAGLPRVAVFPANRARIDESWNGAGLKGTGSHDIVVEDVVVPLDWTFVRGGPSSLDTPLFRYPVMALSAQVLAVVGLGVARAALSEVASMAAGRVSITGAPSLAERAHVQIDFARAEAQLRAARAFFYEATDTAFDTLVRGDDLDQDARTALRLAATHAARTGAEVAEAAYRMCGTTGVFADHPLARFLQDALVVPQHALLADGTWQSAGRLLLGLPAVPGFP